jgi:DNA-binding NarL/FixJ family response regulator
MSLNKIKIVLVDDHPLIRDGMRSILETDPRFSIVADAEGENEALAKILDVKPHLVITDVFLGNDGNGIDLIRQVRTEQPAVKFIVVSMLSDRLYAEKAVQAGAIGYILKKDASRNIISAINNVLDGKTFFSSEIEDKLHASPPETSADPEPDRIRLLTGREQEVFRMLGEGYTSQEIAAGLKCAISTINTHRENIKQKLGFRNSADMIKHAIAYKLASEKTV